jgi:hypothetical protein
LYSAAIVTKPDSPSDSPFHAEATSVSPSETLRDNFGGAVQVGGSTAPANRSSAGAVGVS